MTSVSTNLNNATPAPVSAPAEATTTEVAAVQSAVVSSGVIGGKNITSSKGTDVDKLYQSTGTAASFGLEAPSGTTEDKILELSRLFSASDNNRLKTNMNQALATRESLKETATQRLQQLEDQIENANKSRSSSEIAKIFGWIGAALSLVIGAALVATGVGTAAGIAMLAVGVATIAIMAVQETIGFEKVFEMAASSLQSTMASLGVQISEQEARAAITIMLAAAVLAIGIGVSVVNPAGGIGLFAVLMGPILSAENLKESGLDEKAAPWVSLGLQAAIAIAAIAIGIGSSVNSVKSSASSISQAATTATEAAERANQVKTLVANVANYVQLGARIGQGMSQIGQSGANIASGVQMRDSREAEARAQDFLADIFLLQQNFDQQAKDMEKIQESIESNHDLIAGLLSGANRVNTKIATLGQQV